jgi:hypothetical protein
MDGGKGGGESKGEDASVQAMEGWQRWQARSDGERRKMSRDKKKKVRVLTKEQLRRTCELESTEVASSQALDSQVRTGGTNRATRTHQLES